MNIKIQITKKHATVVDTPVIVCGNRGYSVEFIFDSEWDAAAAKTARFVYVRKGSVRYKDVVFTGNTVSVPVLSNIKEVRVGVFAGDLRTTTPARIPCELSIRCDTGVPADPTPSQYDQIMKLIRTGGATDEQVATAVDEYMVEHPGVTGLSNTSKALLLTILRSGVYTSNQKANIAALEAELYKKPTSDDTSGGGDDNTGGEDEGGETEVILTSISATYSGGDVLVGTSVTGLSGIVVTATYSDGSTQTVTDYTLTGTIAEGSNTITVVYEGKTTTFEVTGYELVVSEPVVNLSFESTSENVIPNIGTGGSQYNATIIDYNGSHESSENRLVLNGHAYANLNYALSKSNSFTICVVGAITQASTKKYQRLFRTNTDAPSMYYHVNDGTASCKLTGVAGTITAVSDLTHIDSNTAYAKTAYFYKQDVDAALFHRYVFVGDIVSGLVTLYVDGERMATQPISGLTATDLIGMGDNDQSKEYYADKITISDFRIWDVALTAQQVAAL